MRRAAARAASRRGSSRMMRFAPARPASRTAGGTRVVLPAPVGARSTTAPCRPSAASTSGSTASIGSGARVTATAGSLLLLVRFLLVGLLLGVRLLVVGLLLLGWLLLLL